MIDAPELVALVDALLDGWLTEGRFADAFRARFAGAVERDHALLVGSGSQANLLAVAARCSHLHERPLRAGDEVITPAVGFPTTVTPLYQHGLVPVYVDVELDTYNPSLEAIAAAIGPRTRGVVAAHCLGNPFDAPGVEELCAEHDLVLIEDCCDALGSRIGGRQVGTFGARRDLLVLPRAPHDDGRGRRRGERRPDLGCARSARCASGAATAGARPAVNDVCGRRFEGRYGDLPAGYDHKYVFSHVGFNFKVTDMQAALGVAQLERLAELRRAPARELRAPARGVRRRSTTGSSCRARCRRRRPVLVRLPAHAARGRRRDRRRRCSSFLLERRIDTRLLLAGNLTRQPGFQGREHRVAGPLTNADRITEASLWVGCWPGLTPTMLDWIAESVERVPATG